MKVRDLCVRDVVSATKETSLERAGALMRKFDIGSLPVVDRADRVIGILTDRDCFLEIARRDERPSEIFVDEVMSDRTARCSGEDDALDCLELMRKHRVRRIPVVDEDDRLEGIVSIDDVLCHARRGQNSRELPYDDVIDAFCEITHEYQGEAGARRESRPSRSNGGRGGSRAEDSDREEAAGRSRRLRREEAEANRRPRIDRTR